MNSEAIAVTGISALFAGSADVASFWRNIVAGRDLISDVPATHWHRDDYYNSDPHAPDKVYCQRGSFLDSVGFDALNFGMPPSNVPATDTCQLLALVLAERLFQDIAPDSLSKIDRERISVILGVTGATEMTAHMSGRMARPQWEQGLRDSGLSSDEVTRIADKISAQFISWQESTFPGLLGNVVAGRIANRFDLGGTNCIVDAACASSLGALSMAVNELRLGQSDLVITGGVDTLNDPLMYLCFSKTPALSMSGDCRPFSDQADGTLLGEGLALVALRRLSDAERDGDRIYAVIRGFGTSSDGRSKSVYAPRSAGQARALSRAYVAAGYDPSSVELVEAHGTATKAGDLAEFEGLNAVFAEFATAGGQPWCALGSIKSQIGHTKAAAGVAGLAKAVLALHHKVLPPTIKVERPNRQFKIETTPFYLNTEARPWVRADDHPRRASVSSFGFGGSNFHVALEEYTGNGVRPDRTAPDSSDLVLVSGASERELASRIAELLQGCDADVKRGDDLRRIAAQSRRDFKSSQSHRCAVIFETSEQLRRRLEIIADHLNKQPRQRLSLKEGVYYESETSSGKVAWVFPGQGSQYVGMGRDLAMCFDTARQAWDRAASMKAFEDLPLHQYVFPRPAFSAEERALQTSALRRMEVAQPAIAACSLAAIRTLERFGIARDFVAGHSFGELTALFAAGSISEADLLPISRQRGNAMAQSSGSGSGMTAVTVTAAELAPVLESFANRVVLANHNGPKQLVVSGQRTALDEFEAELSKRRWSFRRLDVDAACHSPLMQSAAQQFSRVLDQYSLGSPQCSVGWNASGGIWSGSNEELKSGLARQLVGGVQFQKMIESLYAAGVRTFIEVGPASVLTGLVNDILSGKDILAVSIDRKGQSGIESLWQALGQLAVRGVAVDWSFAETVFAVSKNAPTPVDARRTIQICGSNPGKPYPANRNLAIRDVPRQQPSRESIPIIPVSSGEGRQPEQDNRQFITASREPFIVTEESLPAEYSDRFDSNIPLPESNLIQDPANDPWLAAFREVQQQTAQAHQAYLRSISDTHQAFLQASLGTWDAPPQEQPARPQVSHSVPKTTYARPSTVSATKPAAARLSVEPAPARDVPRTHVVDHATARRVEPEQVAIPASKHQVPTPVAPVPSTATTGLDIDSIRKIVLEVVADKTGYSVEVLDPTLEIEAGLGIDSIKRVEILSALVDRMPQLEGMDLTEFATYQTLGDVMTAVQAGSESLQVSSGVASAPAAASVAVARPQPAEVQSILMSVVADKTGYPADLIDLDTDIESGLGIDSIKRVEILSSLIDRFPALSTVDAMEFNSQRTLRELLNQVDKYLPASAPLASASSNGSAAPVPVKVKAAAAIDHRAILLAIVADKTGYPQDLLDLDMDIESGLGIDSIKRVEILSSLIDRFPDLATVDAMEFNSQRTLGELLSKVESCFAPVETTQMPEAPRHAASGSEPVHATNGHVESKPQSAALKVRAVTLTESPASGFALPGMKSGEKIAIIAGTNADQFTRQTADELNRILQSRDVQSCVVETVPQGIRGIIHLGGLTPRSSLAAALSLHWDVCESAQRLKRQELNHTVVFVTVQDTGGHFGQSESSTSQALTAGLSGLAKTAHCEWPDASIKAIDLERSGRTPQSAAGIIADELLFGGTELEVAFPLIQRRSTLCCTAWKSTQEAAHSRNGSSGLISPDRPTFLVSGGGRGVTAAALLAMAKRIQPRFILLGRTALEDDLGQFSSDADESAVKRRLVSEAQSNGTAVDLVQIQSRARRLLAQREIQQTIDALRSAGSEVRYLTLDVCDEVQLTTALADIRQTWGPIHGLIHGAGVLADKRIVDKTQSQFQKVFQTKVDGAQALLNATRQDPLRWIALFSSITARLGNAGQSDYAAANEVLNKLAHHESRQRGDACRVLSINWGAWNGGMVDDSLRGHFEKQGVSLIPIEPGAELFSDLMLQSATPPVEIVVTAEAAVDIRLDSPVPACRDRAAMEFSLNRFPFMVSHCVKDEPVLPVVLVVEWFVRVLRQRYPHLTLLGLHNLKVLKGISLADTETTRLLNVVLADPYQNGTLTLQMELRGANEFVHYRCSAELSSEVNGTTPRKALDPSGGRDWPWTVNQAYEQLFHGPDFHVLRTLDAVNETSARATLVGTNSMQWEGGPWSTDPAALDGGLQLAVLWGIHRTGRTSLPSSIGAVRFHRTANDATLIHCDMRTRSVGALHHTFDIHLTTPEGEPIVDLVDVDMTLLVSEIKR